MDTSVKELRIAIDGPAGAGKSSIAKELAHRLKLSHIDTGSMYRAIAYKALKDGIPFDDGDLLAKLLKDTALEIIPCDDGQKIILDGDDVTGRLRTQEVSQGASDVSKNLAVRKCLVEKQKNLALKPGVVMDGRDIGTVVMQNATHKFFLTATARERSLRRYNELERSSKLDGKTLDDIQTEIELRDYQDYNREHSPLRRAHDVIEIDTTDMSIEQVVQKMMYYIYFK